MRLFFAAALTAIAGCALAVAISQPSTAFDGDAALARHRSFVGWQASDGTITSMRLNYTYQNLPTPGASPAPPGTRVDLTVLRKDLAYREIHPRGHGLSYQYGFTGTRFWSSDYNANTVLLLENVAKRNLTDNIIDDEGVAFVPNRVLRTEKLRGVDVTVVRITPDGGLPADLYINSATGAYMRRTIDPENPFVHDSVDYDGYTEILPGKKIPSGFHGVGATAGFVLIKAEANTPLANDELKLPKPTTSWTFASNDPVPISVAVGTSGGRSVRLRASINGHEGTFLLDSGASGTIVYRPFADTLDLEPLGDSAFSGVNGGVVQASLGRAKTIAFGPNILHDDIVQIADGHSQNYDGILGFDFLANALVDVDIGGLKLTILDPSQYAPQIEKGAYPFSVNLSSRQPGVFLKTDSGAIAHPIIDSGDDFFVLISDDLRQSGKIIALEDTLRTGAYTIPDRIYYGGVDGASNVPATCSRLNGITVGPYRYEKALTCFGSPNVFGRDGGLIGFDFLRHFNWTFDYPENKMVLTPNGL